MLRPALRALAWSFATLVLGACLGAAEKPRLLVLTDIGGDPDDRQAMVRLMLYANEFDIEGLIASSAGTPGELGTDIVRPDLIREIVNAYGQVRGNLLLHDSRYPTAQHLLDRVRSGNPHRGTAYVGAAHDTDGSRRIVAVVDAADPRPVDIAIWGGQTDLAQALWRVRNDRGASGLATFIRRFRVHDIADQDGIASWMFQQFPGMWYILDRSTTSDKLQAAFRGMYLGGDESLTSRAWLDAHVRVGHGPLGALYPDQTWTSPNPHGAMKEGDTPSWFYFLPRGLNQPTQPQWGGWGGRFDVSSGTLFRDAADTVNGSTGARNTVNRWRPRFQAEFQARMDWCVKPFSAANHAPAVTLQGVTGSAVVALTAPAGSVLSLAAGGSDPDGHARAYRWWHYREPSTYSGSVAIGDAATATARVSIPSDAAGRTIHVIVEVTDNGSPALTTGRRAVIAVGTASGNAAPSVAITAPTAGASFTAPATIAIAANASDSDGSIARVEFHNGGTRLGEDTSAPYAFSWSGVAAGTYTIGVTATDNAGARTSRSLSVTVAAAPQAGDIRINFQPTGSVAPTGYRADDGSAFSATRGYGWDSDRRAHARDRGINADQRLDTFVSGGSRSAYATWEYALPNGTYLVSASVGDAQVDQGPHRVEAEGVRLVGDLLTAANRFASASDVPVTVGDGRLTVRIGAVGGTVTNPDGSDDTTLNYLVIRPAEPATVTVTGLAVASGRTCTWFDLAANQRLYTDRTFAFGAVPAALQGALALRTANDDKLSPASDTGFITFTIDEEARVYVLYTTVNSTLAGTWMTAANGWRDEPMTVDSTLGGSERVRLVRSRLFPAGQVRLGGNGGTSSTTSMFNVVVVPTAQALPAGTG